MSTDPAETIALFRFRIVADATNSRLSPAERGQIVRELARQSHVQPDGSSRVYSRGTLDRWLQRTQAPYRVAVRSRPPDTAGFKPLKIRWSLVCMGYQPELTLAWLHAMRTFGEESKQDRVFEETLFWVVTRSLNCFY